MSWFRFLLGLAVINLRASALQVTPGSSCSAVCLNDTESDPLDPESSNTDISEITCHDEEYDTTSTGIKYRNCIECLQKSNATHEAESDTEWFLYNLRYSVDICVYGFPNASKRVSSPCDIITACEPLKTAMEAGGLDPDRDQYEYCTIDGDRFSARSLEPCVQCLSTSADLSYMANFMTALKAGCDQKPRGGNLLGLAGALFSTSRVEITDPPSNQTLPSASDSGALTQGTIVGIAVGAALLLLGGIALFWVYHRKQKRMYGDPLQSDYDPRGGSKSITPPLVGGFGGSGGGGGSGGPTDAQKLAAMAQVSEYELRSQQPGPSSSRYYHPQPPNNNAEYYDALEKEMFNSFQPNTATITTTITSSSSSNPRSYAFHKPSASSGSGAPLKLPPAAHPAYDPRAASHGRTTTTTRPEPPRPARAKTDKADSYALQAYLSPAEDASNPQLPGPPPGPPPAAAASSSSSSGVRGGGGSRGTPSAAPDRDGDRGTEVEVESSSVPLRNTNTSADTDTTTTTTTITTQQQRRQQKQPQPTPQQQQQHVRAAPPPPPPPPPPRTWVPALRLPSVPRIRVPKKYAPPQINVEEPTPVERTAAEDRGGRRPWGA